MIFESIELEKLFRDIISTNKMNTLKHTYRSLGSTMNTNWGFYAKGNFCFFSKIEKNNRKFLLEGITCEVNLYRD
jgi:hypothetical protein